MKVSINVMKWYADPAQWKLGLDDLVAKIGAQLGAVEEVTDLAPKYKDVVIARVVSTEPIQESDHLNLCKIDDGHTVDDIQRDQNGHVQVVCGAPNVRQGMLVAWLPPGSTVPQTYNKEPFVLGKRPIMSHTSNGMLASARELDISDDHQGIIEVDTDAKPGDSFAGTYGLAGDAIIDIENKMFTHRPDCFGSLGVAREIAGIQNLPFTSPDWYAADASLPEPEKHVPLQVRNEIPELVPRYSAIVIDGVQVGPSPLWLQITLRKLGIRPINNVVDVTNYMMVLTGQPLHAFDYDKVEGATIVVRHPKKGETVPLLDGRVIQPHPKAMLICDAKKPIGLGGMMGGANSEIDQNTTRVVLESATFDMFTIRRTSMMHGIFTDAVTRFSKGQSPLQTVAVLAKAAIEVKKIAGGAIGSAADAKHLSHAGSRHIALTSEFINQRLGLPLTAEQIAVLLNNVEITAETHGGQLTVTPPFWRTDLEIPEDIVEEVGRLYGYSNLPHQLPQRDTAAAPTEPMDDLKNRIRIILAQAGANELQTYSFVPSRLLKDVGQQKEHAFKIRNAISPDLEHYRLSLTPSLLEKVHPNIKAGYKQFGLFELNKIHIKGEENLDCDGLPREYQTVAFVLAAGHELPGAPYYHAKKYLDYLLGEQGVVYRVAPIDQAPGFEVGRQVFAPFEPKRSGYVYTNNGDFAGFVGEYRPAAARSLKLPVSCAGFEVDLERLLLHQRHLRYQPLLKFPPTGQDMCLRVPQHVAYAQLESLVRDALSSDQRLRVALQPLDIYQRASDTTHKQITFRITLQHHDRTLTTADVNDMLDAAVSHVAATINDVTRV